MLEWGTVSGSSPSIQMEQSTTCGGKPRRLTTGPVREVSPCVLTWNERRYLQPLIRSAVSPDWKSTLKMQPILQRVFSLHCRRCHLKPPALKGSQEIITKPYILTSHRFPNKTHPGTLTRLTSMQLSRQTLHRFSQYTLLTALPFPGQRRQQPSCSIQSLHPLNTLSTQISNDKSSQSSCLCLTHQWSLSPLQEPFKA